MGGHPFYDWKLCFTTTRQYIDFSNTDDSCQYSKTCLKQPLKRTPKIGFQYRSSLNLCQKYCRMLQWKHSAILPISIKLRFPIKDLVLSILKWPLKTGFTVHSPRQMRSCLFPVLKYHHVTTAEVIQLFSCSTVHGISTAHN